MKKLLIVFLFVLFLTGCDQLNLDTINQTIDNVEDDITEVTGDLSGVKEDLNGLLDKFDDFSPDELIEEVNGITERIMSLEDTLDEFSQDDIDGLVTDLETLSSRIQDLEDSDEVTLLESEVDALTLTLTNVADVVALLSSRLDDLEDRVDLLEETEIVLTESEINDIISSFNDSVDSDVVFLTNRSITTPFYVNPCDNLSHDDGYDTCNNVDTTPVSVNHNFKTTYVHFYNIRRDLHNYFGGLNLIDSYVDSPLISSYLLDCELDECEFLGRTNRSIHLKAYTDYFNDFVELAIYQYEHDSNYHIEAIVREDHIAYIEYKQFRVTLDENYNITNVVYTAYNDLNNEYTYIYSIVISQEEVVVESVSVAGQIDHRYIKDDGVTFESIRTVVTDTETRVIDLSLSDNQGTYFGYKNQTTEHIEIPFTAFSNIKETAYKFYLDTGLNYENEYILYSDDTEFINGAKPYDSNAQTFMSTSLLYVYHQEETEAAVSYMAITFYDTQLDIEAIETAYGITYRKDKDAVETYLDAILTNHDYYLSTGVITVVDLEIVYDMYELKK